MTPTKVLFLDIDGVLNSMRSCEAFSGFPHCFDDKNMARFDHVALALIRKLCEETDVSICLSSSWRIGMSKKGLHDCANALDLPIFDKTPVLDKKRGEEIKQWLDDHPGVATYAIVDDDSDILAEQIKYFVKTDMYEGLTFRNYRELKGILNGGEAEQMRDDA